MARYSIPQPVSPDDLRPFVGRHLTIHRQCAGRYGTLEGVLLWVGQYGEQDVLPAGLREEQGESVIDASGIYAIEAEGLCED